MKKLAIITTHPIQYNAPFFKLLQESKTLQAKVFYTWGKSVLESKYDPGFNKSIEWDIPLLDGYDYEFLENTAKEKGSHHFRGIINPGIIKKINQWQPDALLVYGWKFYSHLKVMRHFKNRIPVWFRGDSVLLSEKRNLKNFSKKILLKWVYKHVDTALYTGASNKAYFEKFGLKEKQLVRAPHAIDNGRFENVENRFSGARAALRDKLGIQNSDMVFLYAGKLTATKDIGTLISAFSKLNGPHVHLVIVGNGPEEGFLKTTYREINNLHFVDFQNQQAMPGIYQLCDIFVLSSVGETWGLAVNEAMAAGKAILMSNKCGGAADLVKNGENGYTFEAGNAADLLNKMRLTMTSQENLELMQSNSARMIKYFTYPQSVKTIENLINK